jgi:hypothetical protein
MKIPFEIKVNSALENAFAEHLQKQLNGFYMDEDKAYTQEILDDVRSHDSEAWSDTTKQELGMFLMLRAGFTVGCGYCAEDWEEVNK